MGKLIMFTLFALSVVGLLYCYSSDDAARDARLADQRRQERLAEIRRQDEKRYEEQQCDARNQAIRDQARRLSPGE